MVNYQAGVTKTNGRLTHQLFKQLSTADRRGCVAQTESVRLASNPSLSDRTVDPHETTLAARLGVGY